MMYDNEKRVIEKYNEVLGMVSQANPSGTEVDGTPHYVDNGMALVMMKQDVHMGGEFECKGVPEDFDWEQFKADLEHCELPEEVEE